MRSEGAQRIRSCGDYGFAVTLQIPINFPEKMAERDVRTTRKYRTRLASRAERTLRPLADDEHKEYVFNYCH
jgi:hypothetical protein